MEKMRKESSCGEWRVKRGGRRVEGGEWRVEGGEWRVEGFFGKMI